MPRRNKNAVKVVNRLGANWSPDLDAYASGRLDITQVRCALCQFAPCQCPPFMSAEYVALIKCVHGLDGQQ